MNKRILWPVLVVLVIGLVAIFYPRRATEPPVPVELPAPAAETPTLHGPEPEPEPTPRFVEDTPAEADPALPELDESDDAARAALTDAAGAELVEGHLAPDALVRKLVATVDNLSGQAIWMKSRVVPAQEGRFLVEGSDDELQIAATNFERYTALVRLVEALDADQLAAAYRRHYPLLQQAYEELGYPGRQFHNRALEIIDHLLATPQVEGPIRLVRPHVLYKYADPRIEGLSSGQKMLIRVGPDHAKVLREKLIEFRAAIESLSDRQGME